MHSSDSPDIWGGKALLEVHSAHAQKHLFLSFHSRDKPSWDLAQVKPCERGLQSTLEEEEDQGVGERSGVHQYVVQKQMTVENDQRCLGRSGSGKASQNKQEGGFTEKGRLF